MYQWFWHSSGSKVHTKMSFTWKRYILYNITLFINCIENKSREYVNISHWNNWQCILKINILLLCYVNQDIDNIHNEKCFNTRMSFCFIITCYTLEFDDWVGYRKLSYWIITYKRTNPSWLYRHIEPTAR